MAMPPKRASDDEPAAGYKMQRVEQGRPSSPPPRLPTSDFSGSVKRKLQDSKRTGQACDRCKIRKIRCDGRPEGCTPCAQNRTPCRTTDRITGRASTRGHAEAMEAENTSLRAHIAALQAQLKDLGVEPRPAPAYTAALHAPRHPWTSPAAAAADHAPWLEPPPPAPPSASPSPLPGYAPARTLDAPDLRPLPLFNTGALGGHYLGVAAGDALLSHIRGTSLSIFGTQIDITDFVMDEAAYDDSPMSYATLVHTAMGANDGVHVALPPYSELKEYAGWYLRSLNPYTMLHHKPHFMHLVWRFGNDPSFSPSAAETVFVHMMLATIKYQIGARNSEQKAMLDESHAHYKYALGFLSHLVAGDYKLEKVQALAMICHHLRNFPKPGAAWIITSISYLFAVELGLHRSVTAWSDGTTKLTKIEIEMRKRVFWTLLALNLNISGRLGRPMPISTDDIDVEFPEPMNDCLPGEEASLDPFHQCSFQVGIQVAKHTIWELELNKTIYAVRHSPRSYVENLRRLEAGIRRWKEELPYELRDPAHAAQEDYIFALYLEYWHQTYHLLLHHPAVCRSMDPTIVSSNLDKCLDASKKMLLNCTEMMYKKSLDIPWINTVVYIAAIFTTLFISSKRKELLSPADMTALKGDMTTWIDILTQCDQFLSSGDRLKNSIAKIVDQALSNIDESIVKRTASESLARAALQTPQHQHQHQNLPQNQSQNQHAPSVSPYESYSESYASTPNIPTDPALTSQPPTYPLPTPITHNYMPHPPTGFDHSYPPRDDGMTPTHAAALAAATNRTPQSQHQPQSSHHSPHPHSQSHPQPAYVYPQHAGLGDFAPQDWRQWTSSNMQPSDAYHGLGEAGGMLGLGGRDEGGGGGGGEGSIGNGGGGNGNANVNGGQGQNAHWPEIQFPGNGNGSVGVAGSWEESGR